jgi:hypothetical protein
MLKRIILWDHERGSWQYDVFCLLIIAFIFLSPKTLFNAERPATRADALSVKTEVISARPAVLSTKPPAETHQKLNIR